MPAFKYQQNNSLLVPGRGHKARGYELALGFSPNIIVQIYMREPNDEFSDVRMAASLKVALAISAIGTIYLGVLPARILDWTAAAALNALR
jgi:NADH:ubiquinone oxidoreductase subunit 2 (subunit N)